MVVEQLHGSMLPLNRPDFRCTQKPTICDARATKHYERCQLEERERRAKHKLVERLTIICAHGHEVIIAKRTRQRTSTTSSPALVASQAITRL